MLNLRNHKILNIYKSVKSIFFLVEFWLSMLSNTTFNIIKQPQPAQPVIKHSTILIIRVLHEDSLFFWLRLFNLCKVFIVNELRLIGCVG